MCSQIELYHLHKIHVLEALAQPIIQMTVAHLCKLALEPVRTGPQLAGARSGFAQQRRSGFAQQRHRSLRTPQT